jgi:ParB family transcriptional regulator, chromosome partitioning protein
MIHTALDLTPTSSSQRRSLNVAERGIGRGLAAILPAPQEREESLHHIPLSLIDPNPRQPRTSFPEPELRELASSIQARGVLQPVLVRAVVGGRYELIAGERRLRAARLANLDRIPALVRSTEEDERLELALIENMARENLNPVEAARACAALVDELGLSKEEVGRRVGRSRAAISNMVRLLDLPDDVLVMLESGELSEGHGRAILQVRDRTEQRGLAREVVKRRLSVRETEDRARVREGSSATGATRTTRPSLVPADALDAYREIEEALTATLGREARVRPKRKGCTVEIPFDDVREIHQLVRRLNGAVAA